MSEVNNDNLVKPMVVVDLKQGSPEWLEWRSKGITATDVPIILGLSPYKTQWQLWAEKTGKINPVDISANPNVKRGNRLEDEARKLAEGHGGEVLVPVCGEHGIWNVLRASFDGIDAEGEPVELKAPSDSTWEEIVKNGTESATYKMYEAQVHAQCLVAGKTKGQLMFYRQVGGSEEDQTFDIELSHERAMEILEKSQRFWKLVETKTPPLADPERDWFIPDDPDTRFRWDAQSDAWRNNHQRIKSLKDQLKALETDQKAIQSELITLMGPFMQADISGVKVSRFTKNGNVDYKALLSDWLPKLDPAIHDDYRKPSRSEARFTMSEDDLVNLDIEDVITNVKAGYF